MEKISVIVPCRNEEKYLENFLNSVLATDYPKEFMEVLLIDGNSTDSTPDIIRRFADQYNFIRLFVNEKRTVPYALNLGIQNSGGNFIFILGAHSDIPKNYFSKLIEYSLKLDADNVGGVCRTEVRNKSLKTNSIIKVLSNKFGVGNSFFRIGSDEIMEVDNISFGCYRKSVYTKIGYYDTRLERNQDIELNKRLKSSGGKIYLAPDVWFTYYAREDFAGLAKNNFQTGLWNIMTVYYTKRLNSISLRHLVPLLFLLSLILPLIIGIWIPFVWLISAGSFLLYMISLATISFYLKDKTSSFVYNMISFIVLHFSYGFGSLLGIFKFRALIGRIQ